MTSFQEWLLLGVCIFSFAAYLFVVIVYFKLKDIEKKISADHKELKHYVDDVHYQALCQCRQVKEADDSIEALTRSVKSLKSQILDFEYFIKNNNEDGEDN